MHKINSKKNGFLFIICLALPFFSTQCSPQTPYTIPTFGGFAQLDHRQNRVIFVGDTQLTSLLELFREDNQYKMPLVIHEIQKHNPALIIHLGDLVFCGSSQNQWLKFDSAHQGIIKNQTPYFPIPGNHEYWCSDKKTFKNFFSRFPHLHNQTWYSFRFKTIGFILLNSNFSHLKDLEKRAQLLFYQDTLAEFNRDDRIDYIIVCCHNPPYTYSKVVHPDKKVQQYFVEPFKKSNKTVAFLSGHCHSYERFMIEGKYFIVTGGGGGPRQELHLNKKKRLPIDQFKGPKLRFLNFCQMTIEPNQLHFQIFKLEDPDQFVPADSFYITCPTGGITKVQ